MNKKPEERKIGKYVAKIYFGSELFNQSRFLQCKIIYLFEVFEKRSEVSVIFMVEASKYSLKAMDEKALIVEKL